MTGCVVGEDRDDLLRRAAMLMDLRGQDGDAAAWLDGLPDVMITGTIDEAAERLARLEKAGVDRAMMQMQAHEDVEMVHVLGRLAQTVA